MKRVLRLIPALLMAWGRSGCDSNSESSNTTDSSRNVYDVYSYETYTLTEDMKYSLAYMWHEEKMAHDIYLALNELHASAKMAQIANMGEATHISMVRALVEKYDLNVTNLNDYEVTYSQAELDTMAAGEFAVPELQSMYDSFYTEGSASLEASLRVGCKVEVNDVNDLTLYISQAGEADDLADVFTYLRQGSYKHYWALDGELKTLGVVDGCCSVGVVNGVDYCHEEYPNN